MSDVLGAGIAWLEDQRTAHMTKSVTYARPTEDGEDVATVDATVYRKIFKLPDSDGVLIRVEAWDFLLLAADLLLDGAEVLPQAGDQIRVTNGDTVHTYEVLSLGGEPCWTYSDSGYKALRIHTKLTKTEVVS